MSETPKATNRRSVLQLVGVGTASLGMLAVGGSAEASSQPRTHQDSRKGSPMKRTRVQPTVKGPANRFTGDVYVTPIKAADEESPIIVANVRFTPGACSNWHSHPEGQTLHVTEGAGLVAGRDGQVIRMKAGDTVWTPPGVEHWHGGTAEDFMCHLAILEPSDEGVDTIWLEPVSAKDYRRANKA